MGELTSGDNLVKANGLIEASTIAVLFACVLMYGLAVIANFFIPKLPTARQNTQWHFLIIVKGFTNTIKIIFTNK